MTTIFYLESERNKPVTLELISLEELGSIASGTYLVLSELGCSSSDDVTIHINAGVTLIFQGGKFVKGNAKSVIIEGLNTAIMAPIAQIFGEGVEVKGSWIMDRAYPQWFDEKVGTDSWTSASPTNCAPAINKAIIMKQIGEVFLPRGKYFISESIICTPGIQLRGEYDAKISNNTQEEDKDKTDLATFIIPYVTPQGASYLDGFYKSTSVRIQSPSGETPTVTITTDLPLFMINVKVELSETGTETKYVFDWAYDHVQPSGVIKDIYIDNSYYKHSGRGNLAENLRLKAHTLLSTKIACLVGGGFTFESDVFTNFLNAIKWTSNYADNKRVLHCQFSVSTHLKEGLATPSYLIDMGTNGDSMTICDCSTDWNSDTENWNTEKIVHNYRALKVGQCHGGSITDCILNTDVLINGATNLVFSGNHLEAGAQLYIVNSNLAIYNNWFEKGKRPSVVFDVKSETEKVSSEGCQHSSQAQLSGNSFITNAPLTLYTDTSYTAVERTKIKFLCPYDIALCNNLSYPYELHIVENYRFASNKYSSNQPTGILLCEFESDANSGWIGIDDFNNHSYYLSTQGVVLRKGQFVANRYFNEIPNVSLRIMDNNQVLLEPSVDLPKSSYWAHAYRGQVILDAARKIAGPVVSFKYGDYTNESDNSKIHGNLIGLSWDDNSKETSFLLRIVRTPSLTNGVGWFDYVEIPIVGCRYLYDNYISVNGYRWQTEKGTTNSIQFPASTPASIDAVEFHNESVRCWGSKMPSTDGWMKNDTVFNNGTANSPVIWMFNGTSWTTR